MSIALEHVGFSYGAHEVLHDISAVVDDGMLVSVLGSNGVGKSTLFRCMLGLNGDYSGSITINGKDARTLSVAERAREVAYIPQTHSSVYDYEVIDVVLMSTGADLGILRTPGEPELARAEEALRRVGVERLAHRTFTQISGGEQQLVLIARALAQNARTIIMDEPTSALDYGNTVRVLTCIRRLARDGYSIVQSTHQPDQAFLYADKTLVLNGGRVYAYGPPKDVVTSETVSAIYGVDVDVQSLYGDKVRVCVPVQALSEQ